MALADRNALLDDISSLPRLDFNVRARTHDPALSLANHFPPPTPIFATNYTSSFLRETSSSDTL